MKYLALSLLTIAVLITAAAGQRRDFVTDHEAELIREAQEVDARIEVLMKFVDRRLAAAGIAGHKWSPPKKNSETWGPEPEGTRSQLLNDIRRILQKSIDDIDDIASRRTTSTEGNEVGGKLFPKAMRNLVASATRFKPIFEAEAANSKSEAERGLLLQSIQFCNEIIEASSKVPADEPTKKKKT